MCVAAGFQGSLHKRVLGIFCLFAFGVIGALGAMAWLAPSAGAFNVYNNTTSEVEAVVQYCTDDFVRVEDEDCEGDFEQTIPAGDYEGCHWENTDCNPTGQRHRLMRADIHIPSKKFACRVIVPAGGWVSVYQTNRTYAGLRESLSKEYRCVARYKPSGGSEEIRDVDPRHVGSLVRNVAWLMTADPQYDNGDNDRKETNDEVLTVLNKRMEDDAAGLRGVLVSGDLTQNSRPIDEFYDYRWAIDDLASFTAYFDIDETGLYYDQNVAGFNRWYYDTVGNHDLHSADFGQANACSVVLAGCVDKESIHLALELRARSTPLTKNGHDEGPGLYSWDWHDIHFANVGVAPIDEAPGDEAGTACAEAGLVPPVWTSCSDSDPQRSGGNPGAALSFLRDDLAENVGDSGRPVIINQHYGVDARGFGCKEGAWSINSNRVVANGAQCTGVEIWWNDRQRKEFWDVIDDYNVVAIFFGHDHVAEVSEWKYRFYRPEGKTTGPAYIPAYNAATTHNNLFLRGEIGDHLGCTLGLNKTCLEVRRFKVSGTSYTQIESDVITINDTPDQNTIPNYGLNTSPRPSLPGDAVAITATLGPAPTKPTPTGTVTFFEDGIGIPGCAAMPLVGGVATCNRTFTEYKGGTVLLSYDYSGDAEHAAGTSSEFQHTLERIDTVTTLARGAVPAAPVTGEQVTFTATVARNGSTGAVPTGEVDFIDNEGGISSCQGVALVSGVATCTVAIGPPFHSTNPNQIVVAIYGGTNEFETSSSLLTVPVAKADTTPTMVVGPATAVTGQLLEYTVKVAADAPGSGTPQGLVEFYRDGVAITSCNNVVNLDSGGNASCRFVAGAAGSFNITMKYLGNVAYNASESAPFATTIAKGNLSLLVGTSPTGDSVTGQSVTFQTRLLPVAPAEGIPTGTVDILDGTVVRCDNVNLVNLGEASCTFVPEGVLTLRYDGDSSFNGGTFAIPHTVNNANTTTALTTPSPVQVGQNIVLTANVAAVAPGAGTPGGKVQFRDSSSSLLCEPNLTNGQATCSIPAAGVGVFSFSATYVGSAGFNTSTDTASVTVNSATSSTALTVSNSTPVNRQAVTYTATVSGAVAATGTVDFTTNNGATSLCEDVALNTGVATCIAALPAGTYQVVGTYSGSQTVATSSGAVSQTVAKGQSNVALATGDSPSEPDEAVTFTATVSAVAPANGTPSGTVDFSGACQDVVVSLGSAVCTFVPTGSGTVTASYSGDGEFLGDDGSVSQTVKHRSAVALTSSVNPSVTGQSVTFTASVTSTSGTPSGSVTFKEGVTSRCAAVPIVSGTASCSFIPSGTNTVTATYSGDGSFGASTGQVAQTVNKAATSLEYTHTYSGSRVNLRAEVKPVAPGAGTPTGTVAFGDARGPFPGCSAVPLQNGVATCSGEGSRIYAERTSTASYGGNAGYQGSSASKQKPAVYFSILGITIVLG